VPPPPPLHPRTTASEERLRPRLPEAGYMRALPTGTQETHLHRNIPAQEGTPMYHGGSFHSKYRVSQAREVTQVSNVMRRWEYARAQIHVHTQERNKEGGEE
jgi:hypothetical protein